MDIKTMSIAADEIKKQIAKNAMLTSARSKEWFASELGGLFEKYVSAHERAVRRDAELSMLDDVPFGAEKKCVEMWKISEDLENQLRMKLKEIEGIK